MKAFKPRQKKPVKPVIRTKTVRVNRNTQIEVSIDVPDELAIQRYYERITRYGRAPYGFKKPTSTPNYPIKNEFKEIPVGDILELEELIEETQETEEE